MEERAVTWGGTTRSLDPPFFVLATQNPIEQAGTYPLPEAQLDRFLLHVAIDYPTADEEVAILAATTGDDATTVPVVLGGEDVVALQQVVRQVHISRPLLDHVARLVRASRPGTTDVEMVREMVAWGAGPRAGQALVLTAKAHALLAGRFAVTPDDLKAMAAPVLRHRLVIGFRGQADGVTADDVIARLLASVTPPVG